MRNVVLVQIFQSQHQLPEVLAGNLGIQWDRWSAKLDIHNCAAGHEFENEVERIRGRDVDCFI
jgi:hypothetical protein